MKPNGNKNQNEITLTVVVNGTPYEVVANVNTPLLTVIPEALRKSENTGRSPEDWRLLDANGTPYDQNRKIGEYNFGRDARLYLSLKEGVGG